jgi:hypothetical protein
MKMNPIEPGGRSLTAGGVSRLRFSHSMVRRPRSDIFGEIRGIAFAPILWMGPDPVLLVGEGRIDGPVGSLSAQAAERWVDAICSEIVEQVLSAKQPTNSLVNPSRLNLHFDSGRLAGLDCIVTLAGPRVRCSFRTRSAVLRRSLSRARRQLAGQLEGAGFVLQQFEVRS